MQRLQAEIDTLTRQRDTARADLAAAEVRGDRTPSKSPWCRATPHTPFTLYLLLSIRLNTFIFKSRFEAERQKMEASAVAKMEAEVLRRVTQEQERASQVEARLRDSQRQQMENLMQRHRTEVEDMTSRHEKVRGRRRHGWKTGLTVW